MSITNRLRRIAAPVIASKGDRAVARSIGVPVGVLRDWMDDAALLPGDATFKLARLCGYEIVQRWELRKKEPNQRASFGSVPQSREVDRARRGEAN